MVVQKDNGRTYTSFPDCTCQVHASFTFAQRPPLISCSDWSRLMLHLHKKLEPRGRHNPSPDWFWAHDSFAWGATNQALGTTKEEVTRERKRKAEPRPFLWRLVCPHASREYCLLNKSCLIELSWSVISILCYDKTRTEGEELTQYT